MSSSLVPVDVPTAVEPRNRGGRPRKRVKYADVYKATLAELHALLALVPDSLRELIVGVYVVEQTARGGRRVYQQPPSTEAIKVLLDRTLGKVPALVSVAGKIEHEHTEVDLSVLTPVDRVRLYELALARERARRDAVTVIPLEVRDDTGRP